jgi:hypothetical protein
MNGKNLACMIGGLILGAVGLCGAGGAGDNKGAGPPPRCPCVDPTPDRANINPAKYCGEYGLHVCAFHVGKDDPSLQVEAHHYCTPLRDGVFQCMLYDRDKGNAKLLGVEYVVSDDIYKTLPAEEKKLWHPHEYEIRNGLFTLPGVPADCEKKLLNGLLKTWGKVWHTWPDPTTDLPIGAPALMWSATGKGQVRGELVKVRDERYKIDIEQVRKHRDEILPAPK